MSRRQRRAVLRFVDLFCGVGLAATGLGPDWECVLAVDKCRWKATLHRANHGGAPLVEGDVRFVDSAAVPRSDLLWCSSPCLGFSSAGRRKGLDDDRSSAVFFVPKLLHALGLLGWRPPVVVIENVAGFLGSCEGADFPDVIQCFVDRGYRPGALVMDAALWTPMSRVRVFVVLLRSDVEAPEGCVSADPPADWCTPPLMQAVERLSKEARAAWIWWTMPPPPPRAVALAELLDDVPPERWFGPGQSARLLDLLTPGGRAAVGAIMRSGRLAHGVSVEKSDPEKTPGGWTYAGRQYGRRRIATFREGEVYTLLASATGSSRQRLVEIRDGRIRLRDFTPAELGRFMGVPRDFVLPDSVGLAMRALGDAVAVPVVRHLSCHLLEPLSHAAREITERSRTPAPQNWRRPIKSETVGVLTYFLPRAHLATKAAAAAEGRTLQDFVVAAVSHRVASTGRPPLARRQRQGSVVREAAARPVAPRPCRRRGKPSDRSPAANAKPPEAEDDGSADQPKDGKDGTVVHRP